MNKNERLLRIIGEADQSLICDGIEKKPKTNRTAIFAAAGICAAAAVFVFTLGSIIKKPCGIFPKVSYKVKTEELASISPEIGAEGMGFEGISAYEDEFLKKADPVIGKTDFTALPVFKNRAYSKFISTVYFDLETLNDIAENAAKALGIGIESTDVEYAWRRLGNSYEDILKIYEDAPPEKNPTVDIKADSISVLTAKCSGEKYNCESIEIEVCGNGTAKISFLGCPEDLIKKFESAVDEESTESLNLELAEKFSGLLQFASPKVSVSEDISYYKGEKLYTSFVYELSDDPVENLLNYYFKTAEFSAVYNENRLNIYLEQKLSAAEYLGDYPVISQQQAEDMLLSGKYISTVPDDLIKNGRISDEDVKMVQLVYRNGNEKYYQPYYKFYVEISLRYPNPDRPQGLKEYGVFYVPAVEPQYLTDIETWDGSFN